MSTAEAPQMELQPMEVKPVQTVNLASSASSMGGELEEKSNGNGGEFFEFELNGKIVNLKLLSRGDKPKDTTSPGVSLTSHEEKDSQIITKEMSIQMEKQEKREHLFSLFPDSTNAWLFVNDEHAAAPSEMDAEVANDHEQECCMTDNMANKIIAIIIIALQICAYILMTNYLIDSRTEEFEAREKSCYGPNCKIGQPVCMNLTTGGLMSVLLIGFLWADVVNVLSIFVFRFHEKNKLHWFGAAFLILSELITAIVCGFLVGLYSENDFDAIGGAVGILFVHDLDEKVFASMQLFRGTKFGTVKKLIAVGLWVFVSVTVAASVACKFSDGSFFNATGELQCREAEYKCYSDSTCIWYGFVCNGVEDCSDGSDEGSIAGCIYQSGLNNEYCPADKPFMCIEDGSCLDEDKQCDGIIDCPDGSDEGRAQNCTEVIAKENCELPLTISDKYPNDTYHKQWTGMFKCNNGQCIDARFACDGKIGDCVDGSDEYPLFYKGDVFPGESACPYAQLVECDTAEVLCKIDGRCISKSKVCDGEIDCSDGADEAQCEINCRDEVLALEKFQCGGNIAAITKTYIVQWFDIEDINDTANFSLEIEENTRDWTPDKTDTTDITKLFGYDLFEDVAGECIPLAWRCDGIADCADGTDEDLCSIFNLDTVCDTSYQYQCTDNNECIPTEFLCDDYKDCANGEDEIDEVCRANGVDPDENSCIRAGYDYQCEGYTSFCLLSEQLCDGFPDCPNEEDEADCPDPDDTTSSTTSTTWSPYNYNYQYSSSTSPQELTCNEVTTGNISSSSDAYYSFTFPSQYNQAKITTCIPENQASQLEFWMYGHYTTEFFTSAADDECSCTDGRRTILASIDGDTYSWPNVPEYYHITQGESYAVTLSSPYFSGTFAISVECSTSAYVQGDISGSECEATSDTEVEANCPTVIPGYLPTGDSPYHTYYFNVDSSPVSISSCGSSFDTEIYIYDSSWNRLDYNDDSCSTQSSVTFYPPDFTQQYIAIIEGYFSSDYGDYIFTFGCGATVHGYTVTTSPPVGSPVNSPSNTPYPTYPSYFSSTSSFNPYDSNPYDFDSFPTYPTYQTPYPTIPTPFPSYPTPQPAYPTPFPTSPTPQPVLTYDITSCGQLLTGTLPSGSPAVFSFNVGNFYSGPIRFDTFGSAFDTSIAIYDASYTFLTSNDNTQIVPYYSQSMLYFDAANYGSGYSGTYYLELVDVNAVGGYSQINVVCGVVTPSSLAPIPVPFISNYITACNQVFTGTIAAGIEAIYSFSVGNFYTGPVGFNTCGSAFDTIIGIYDVSNNLLKSNDNTEVTGSCYYGSYLYFDPLSHGASDYSDTYYLRLLGYDASINTNGGSFQINVQCGTTPSPVASPVNTYSPTNADTSIQINSCGQELIAFIPATGVRHFLFDSLTFGINGVYFDGCGTAFNIIMEIYYYPFGTATLLQTNALTTSSPCSGNNNYVAAVPVAGYSGAYSLSVYTSTTTVSGDAYMTFNCY